MTEQTDEQFTPDEETLEALGDEFADDPASIPMRGGTVQMIINVSDIETLEEAIDVAALNFGRYGLDAFYIMVTDSDTREQYMIRQGSVVPDDADEDPTDDDEPDE